MMKHVPGGPRRRDGQAGWPGAGNQATLLRLRGRWGGAEGGVGDR
jgi:hypothetical protein